MPVIARLYSIIIKMHYIEDEHCPPHVHAQCNEHEGIFDIATGEMARGSLPRKEIRLVKRFVKQHRDRLLSMWENQDFEVLDFKG